MAVNYAMTKGATGWSDQYNKFIAEYYGNDSGTVTAGISLKNGATALSGVTIKLQTISSKAGIAMILDGGINIPDTLPDSKTGMVSADDNTIPIVQLPSNISIPSSPQWLALCSYGGARLRYNTGDHTISVVQNSFMLNSTFKSSGKTLWLNLNHIFHAIV